MMEKKEAINILESMLAIRLIPWHEREAIQTALDALKWLDEEEEHERRFDDLVSRQAAIEGLYDVFFDDELSAAYPEEADKVLDVIRKLPSASYQQVKKSDYIRRQSAIDAMCDACSDWCDEGVCKKVSAIQRLPSAQPEVSDINVGDTIYRQAAIDLINARLSQPCKNHTSEFVQGMEDGYCRIRSDIKCLPSAQPEIIRCKDCKYNASSKKCLHPDSFFLVPDDNDYCSYAERKTDE